MKYSTPHVNLNQNNYLVIEPSGIESDQVELATMKILANLHCIADGDSEKRNEIVGLADEMLELPYRNNGTNHQNLTYRRSVISHSVSPSLQRLGVIGSFQTIIARVGAIFFNQSAYLFGHSDAKKFKEIKDSVSDDQCVSEALSTFYKNPFNDHIQEAFQQAKNLIKERQAFAKDNYHLRITLIASGIFTVISLIFKTAAIYTLIGAGISALTAIFMISKYSKSSFRQSKICVNLKGSLEAAEKIARQCRYESNTSPTLENLNHSRQD